MDSKQKLAALCRGQLRSDEVQRKVKTAMNIIQEEVLSNGGTYPHNGGVVSKNEVSRRARIGMTTLYTKKQSQLCAEIDLWLIGLVKSVADEPSRVRLSHAERADAWKIKYEALALSHHLSELDLQSARSDLEKAIARINMLELENSSLRDKLVFVRLPNVFPLRPS